MEDMCVFYESGYLDFIDFIVIFEFLPPLIEYFCKSICVIFLFFLGICLLIFILYLVKKSEIKNKSTNQRDNQ